MLPLTPKTVDAKLLRKQIHYLIALKKKTPVKDHDRIEGILNLLEAIQDSPTLLFILNEKA